MDNTGSLISIRDNTFTKLNHISEQDYMACRLGLIRIIDIGTNAELVNGKWIKFDTINIEQCGVNLNFE